MRGCQPLLGTQSGFNFLCREKWVLGSRLVRLKTPCWICNTPLSVDPGPPTWLVSDDSTIPPQVAPFNLVPSPVLMNFSYQTGHLAPAQGSNLASRPCAWYSWGYRSVASLCQVQSKLFKKRPAVARCYLVISGADLQGRHLGNLAKPVVWVCWLVTFLPRRVTRSWPSRFEHR